MTGRVADVFAVSAVAILLTVAMAAPVLRAPSDRVFGKEIVGRHHDPFTVMQQFGRPISLSIYSQPLTDLGGALIARLSGATAAYNWLVLLSFPLAAIAAYLLARHLELSHAGATVAAFAYAFSPFHVAQAAYHPHVAQTQWIPLYLLALWRCLDHASNARAAWLAAATLAVVLSNFYGGLIAAVITPVAFGAYYLSVRRTHPHPTRSLVITAGSLFALAPWDWSTCGTGPARPSQFDPRLPSLVRTCSATARPGGVIWCRRCSTPSSARGRLACGRRLEFAKGCSSNRSPSGGQSSRWGWSP
ncbi:MAG: hypothetical protein ACR2G6_06185 [Gemmatimonadaceae bacterium]